jgi:hypothetical protein
MIYPALTADFKRSIFDGNAGVTSSVRFEEIEIDKMPEQSS